jgi:hypothetical protein
MTICPVIDAPTMTGILCGYCHVPGWQTIMNKDKTSTKHYPVKLAVVQTVSGNKVRVDAEGILGLTLLQ